MNPWLILNIPNTSDKDAVKRAYMAQLGKHNPEDDPDGFQKLRDAYEQILAEIDKITDDTPISRFMKRVELVYNDFSQRVSVESWKDLLKDDVCTQLATEDDASKEILEFFMQHWYLPGAVLETLNAHFGWLAKKDELKVFIPVGFIDYIENQIKFEYPRYDLFVTDINPDRFIYLFHEVDGLINENKLDGIDPLISEMEETGVIHPCLLHLKARLALTRGDKENALAFAKDAFLNHPDDINTRYTYALILHGTENAKEALPYFQEIFNERPTHFGAERGIIECLISMGEYEEAREGLLDALDKYPSNALLLGTFQHISEVLIEKYLKLHRESPEDVETTFTLAKHYLNRARYGECHELLTKYASQGCHIRYYEYMGECILQKGDAEKAVEYLFKDVSTQKKCRNYLKLAFALYDCQRFDDTIKYAKEGLLLTDDDAVSKAGLHYAKGLAYQKMQQYDKALAAFDEGIKVSKQLQYLYTGKANTYKDMNKYAEAVDCCLEAVALQPYNPEPYAIEMEIYLSTGQHQRILDLIDQAEVYNISQYPRIEYYKACALISMSQLDEATNILSKLILDENINDEEYKPRFYREMSYVYELEGKYQEAVAHMQKAIELDKKKQWPFWELQLGQIYNNFHNGKKAAKVFNRLIKEGTFGTAPYIERGMSYLLMDRAFYARLSFEKAVKMDTSNENDYDRIIQICSDAKKHLEALKWAERELKLYDNAENRIQKAWVLTNLGRNHEAIFYLEKSKKDFKGSERLRHRLAYYYRDIRNDYKKALDEYMEILDINPEYPYIYEDTAYCMSLLNKYDEAIDLLTKAIEKNPQNASLYARRGHLFKDMNRQKQALDDLLQAVTDINMHTNYWYMYVVYNWIGHLYEMYFNDYESALKYYNISLEWNREYAPSIASIGDIYFYLNDYKKAADSYNRALWTGAGDIENLIRRANAYKKSGQKKLAKIDYKEALRRYGNSVGNACHYAHIGECYLGLGKYKKALKYFKLAIENASNCSSCPPRVCHEAYLGMSQYYAETGQIEKALECLEIAIKNSNSVQYNQFKLELTKKEATT